MSTVTSTAAPVAITTTASEKPQYPGGVPYKFSADGNVQRYPGNTTLCHIPADSAIIPGLRALYTTVNEHPRYKGRLILLPAPSWHMTVLDGVCEEECEPGMWRLGKEKKPLADSTNDFSMRLRELGSKLKDKGLAPPYRMKLNFFDARNGVGIGLQVKGATVEEEARMRRLRDALADALGFRAPNHHTYGFHITMAYFLRHMDAGDIAELDRVFEEYEELFDQDFSLGAVEFCTFETMLFFERHFYIGVS